MEGEPGGIDNFQLSLGRLGGDFYSPRHRHNFEQVRFQLEGELDFARDGKMKAGMVGYFPEGMFYGPQSQDPTASPMTIVLQCGGASGSGYLSRKEVKAGMDALKAQGEFKDGVFRRHKDVPGKRNMDGYQAIWEYVNKRPMAYPKPRYSRPFMMDPPHYDWVPVGGRRRRRREAARRVHRAADRSGVSAPRSGRRPCGGGPQHRLRDSPARARSKARRSAASPRSMSPRGERATFTAQRRSRNAAPRPARSSGLEATTGVTAVAAE